MDDFDYKKYSLQKLEDWVCDAISSGGATPQEVYDTIVSAITEYHEHHKKGFDYTTELLSLLKGHRPANFDDEVYEAVKKEYEYYEGNDKYQKELEKDLLTARINANSPYNDGWTRKFYEGRVKKLQEKLDDCMPPWGHSDMEALKYTDEELEAMCAAAEKADKVKKWVLPTEVDGLTGDVFVSFPDDLLEAANLKEGDQVEWLDRGDGSYLLKKVENKPKTHDEMIAEGWTMTADGFWIRE
jgi:antitoxin component of MazEF toxin-antitoxin module